MSCTYECWDRIADAVNPSLALLAIALAIFSPAVRRFGRGRWIALLVLSVASVYGVQWLDQQLSLWSRWGADYSTHTALAVSVGVPIGLPGLRWRLFAIVTLVSYALLMLYQRYHTVTDIVSAAAVIFVFIAAILYGTKWLHFGPSRPAEPNP